MSDRRRRRRAENEDETEEVPVRRRRYNTRRATRDEENNQRSVSNRWTNHYSNTNEINPHTGVRVLGIPFVSVRRYTRSSSDQHRSSGRRQEQDRNTGRRRPAAGSRGQMSVPRSSESSSTARSRVMGQAQTRATSSAGTSRSRLSEFRRNEESPLNQLRMRSYAAMSTGGRSLPRSAEGRRRRDGTAGTSSSARTNRISMGNRVLLRLPVPRPLRPVLGAVGRTRPTTSSSVRSVSHRRPSVANDRARTRSDDEFSAVMRSLDLIRTREAQRQRAILRIVDFSGDRRRSDLGPTNPPRPSRGSNILRSSTSSAQGSASSSRLRNSSSGRENPTIDDVIAAPATRPAPTRPTANVRVRRDESFRGADDHITYNMTHNGNGINIRVAFGTDDDDDSESNDPTFSLSGDSDATTFVSTISDADMSTDDVFFSDTDHLESDSSDSIESASTAASPHSLVSLSLNALHPSPTPSMSSAETDAHDEEEDVEDDDDDDDGSPTLERAIITSMRNVGNPIIFLHNNISVQLLSSLAELADRSENIRNRLRTNATAGNATGHGEGGFTTPPRYNMEPARRQVPESVDCQRAKLIDELNSNTAECVICTDVISAEEPVWPCKNCFNIFHLPCIRRWAKTNRNTDMGGAWICPVCRRPKFCTPNKLRYKCLCGRLPKPKPTPGVTPHCCGQKCKRKCGLLCHPGPCKMTEEETAAVSKATSSGQGSGSDPRPPGSEQDARSVSV